MIYILFLNLFGSTYIYVYTYILRIHSMILRDVCESRHEAWPQHCSAPCSKRTHTTVRNVLLSTYNKTKSQKIRFFGQLLQYCINSPSSSLAHSGCLKFIPENVWACLKKCRTITVRICLRRYMMLGKGRGQLCVVHTA